MTRDHTVCGQLPENGGRLPYQMAYGNNHNQQHPKGHQEYEGSDPSKDDVEVTRGTGALKGGFVPCSDSRNIFSTCLGSFCGAVVSILGTLISQWSASVCQQVNDRAESPTW